MGYENKPILMMAMLLMITLIIAAPGYAALQPNIVVAGFAVKDGEAAVGKTFTLSVTLTNTEPAACAQAVTTTVQSGAPFIMDGLSTLAAGDLCYGASKTVDFPMKIDPTSTGGFYQLTISSTYETSLLAQYSSSNTINMFVRGTPSLDAHIVDSNPLDVYPGDTASITIAVQNSGGFEAQALTAKLSAPSPLDAKWSRSFAPLGTLDAKQTKTTAFSVEVPKDAAAKDYTMTLELSYLDETLTPQVQRIPITFHVREKAQFETSDAGSDALYANSNDRSVRLTLKNTGTDVARKVKIKILPQFPFSTDGSVRYVDMLEPGKSAEVEINVNVDKDATAGDYGIDAIVDFEDAQGKKLQDTTKVALSVEHKGVLRAIFLDYWFLWIVAIGVFIIVRRKRAAATKKK